MICIYHNRDLDGFASGAIVQRKYPACKMIGYDYGQPIPELPFDEEVIMVDVSLPMDDMHAMASRSGWRMTWIDHHISAINQYRMYTEGKEDFLKPVLDNSISACEGTWNYLNPNILMPEGIRLLGEYDTWKNQDKEKWDNLILPFQFGMRLKCNSVETFPHNVFWDKTFIPCTVDNGKLILKYQSQVNELLCRKAAFEMEWEGMKLICVNGGGFNSDVFKSVLTYEHHAMMMFQYDGKQWTVSIYTENQNIDCSEICMRYGGGGHKKAAGFQVKDIYSVFPAIKPIAVSVDGYPEIKLDKDSFLLSIGGKDIHLSPKEFEIFSLLSSDIGRIFSRDTILKQIWKHHVVGPRTIDVHLNKIKNKIPGYTIENRKGMGFRLVGIDR